MPFSPSDAAVSDPVCSKSLLNVQHQRGARPGAGSAQGEHGLFSALSPEIWEGQECPADGAVVVAAPAAAEVAVVEKVAVGT